MYRLEAQRNLQGRAVVERTPATGVQQTGAVMSTTGNVFGMSAIRPPC